MSIPRGHGWRRRLSALAICMVALGSSATMAASGPVRDWGAHTAAPDHAPNIIVVLLDDVGFADTSAFGGVARTPAFERVAREGIQFTRFHTTGMCSPTRASLLAGRNHHAVGFGRVADWATGTPGYNAMWRPEAASVARVLKDHGYSTAAIGKWHNTAEWEVSPAGPFDRWPTGLGFEYFFGIMNHGGDNHWEPASLYRNTTPVEPVHRPGRDYHLTTDFVDDAIDWLSTQRAAAPDKPYFLYLATGAVHAPHHAPKAWIDAYRGKFDQGWDVLREEIFARQKRLGIAPQDAVLTPRPDEIPAWDTLSVEQQRLFARQMEVFAGYLSHTDHEIDRLLNAARNLPGGESTIVFYIAGDNGASGMEGLDGLTSGHTRPAEQLAHLDSLGGPKHFNDYSSAWAWVGSTPFPWMKQVASHLGGLRVAMAVSWPSGIPVQGATSTAFIHVNDVVPTVLDIIGVPFPDQVDGIQQRPLDGLSFAQILGGKAEAMPPRVQYFEMLGNRALYYDGWLASARHMTPWIKPYPEDFDQDRWELYQLDNDFSQAHDVAHLYPDKLAQLRREFDVQAKRNDVFPLANYIEGKDYGAPTVAGDRKDFHFLAGVPRLPAKMLPRLPQHSFTLSAEVEILQPGTQGILVAYGSRLGGFAWYLHEGQLRFANTPHGQATQILASDTTVPSGRSTLRMQFIRDDGSRAGTVRLFIGQRRVAEQRVERLASSVLGSFGVGRAYTSPISPDYALPFAFSGSLDGVSLSIH